uniref:CBM20 domain-containing protein n=1 Tax=Anabas testudineus TaxID=64144 RepID=A0A7N6AZA4_ANATE
MSENIDDRLRDNECSPETNNEQPVVQSKHVPSPLICYDKDEKCKEEMNPPEVTLHNTRAGNNQLSSKEEKNEGKDEVMTPVEGINGADDGGPASDVTEDVLDKDHLNNFPAVSFGTNSPELDKQEVETVKQKDGLTCHPANVLPIEVDRVKEKMVTSDIIAGRGEECDSSSLVHSSSLPCLSEPLKVDDHSPPGTTDAKAQVSGIFEFEDCQRVQIEVKEDQSDLVFPKKEIQCEKNESVDHQDQQTMMNDDAFDEASDTTAPDTYDNTENSKKVVAVQPMPQSVNVTFRIHYLTCSPYQTVAVTGNQQELGNWKEFIPLERKSHVEWKFVVLDKGEVCRWEECGNRLLETGFGDDLIVHKWWGLL